MNSAQIPNRLINPWCVDDCVQSEAAKNQPVCYAIVLQLAILSNYLRTQLIS